MDGHNIRKQHRESLQDASNSICKSPRFLLMSLCDLKQRMSSSMWRWTISTQLLKAGGGSCRLFVRSSSAGARDCVGWWEFTGGFSDLKTRRMVLVPVLGHESQTADRRKWDSCSLCSSHPHWAPSWTITSAFSAVLLRAVEKGFNYISKVNCWRKSLSGGLTHQPDNRLYDNTHKRAKNHHFSTGASKINTKVLFRGFKCSSYLLHTCAPWTQWMKNKYSSPSWPSVVCCIFHYLLTAW